MAKEDKISIVFKKSILKSILQILLMEYQGFRNYKIIKNINHLFSNLNLEKYKYNPDLLAYIWCIQFASEQWIKGILNPDLIVEAAKRNSEFNETKETIMNFALTTKDSLNPEEVNLIFNLINDGVQYGQIISKKDDFIEQLENIDMNENGAYRKTVAALFDISQSLLNIKYNTNLLVNTTHIFNSSDTDSIKESISQTFDSLEASRNIFKTGIKRLNTLLSPGYENSRLYIYLGLPGAGKSTILLKSALDIRKYNTNFPPKTPGYKPCVLYITMENTFPETISRVWNMSFMDSIMNYSKEEAYEKISKALGIDENSEQNIEIVIESYNYREISTDDLYAIVKNLQEQKLEVVALVLDYIKRIRPSVPVADNVKLELGRITNELKTFAKVMDIPVITAHQMNRAAAATVDNAIRSGKSDVTKLVGRENVGDAWEVLEVGDWVAVLNAEEQTNENGTKKYMVLNVVKRRSVDNSDPLSTCTYMVHPFVGTSLKLADDLLLEKSLSLKSLLTDIDVNSKEKKNAVNRLKNGRFDFENYTED